MADRRRLATLFVDIASSTSLLVHHPPEIVLGVVQCFFELVTETASRYDGHVKDYEGDGALLYFGSVSQAVHAALAIRTALAQGRCEVACAAGPGIAARMSVTVGEVAIGAVGTRSRRGMALVGPSVNVGARLLKSVAPGGIIVSAMVIEALRTEAPELAARFRLADPAFEVPGGDGITVATFVIPPEEQELEEPAPTRPM